jgi:ADP-ribose pyrophosphatase
MGDDQLSVPQVVSRRESHLSPWFTVVEKDVLFPRASTPETYHALRPLPYVAVVAVTPDGKIPVVRQYRPAVECFTWELPAGLIDNGGSAAATCRRELIEETGLRVLSLESLGSFHIDTGRVEGVQHVFLARCGPEPSDFDQEYGVEVRYIDEDKFVEWIERRRITALPHIAAFCLARMHGALAPQSARSAVGRGSAGE